MIKVYPDYKIYFNENQNRPYYFIKTTPGRVVINNAIRTGLSGFGLRHEYI